MADKIKSKSTAKSRNDGSEAKLADVPKAKKAASVPPAPSEIEAPDSENVRISTPVIIQISSDGKWENKKPIGTDEEQLNVIIKQLVSSKAIAAAHSYCCKCAEDSKDSSRQYVPVIVMPLYPPQTAIDIDEADELKVKSQESETKLKGTEQAKGDDKDRSTKPKKRPFIMQRLTNFDLMSQW